MANYYRYVNKEELEEKDIILLEDDEVKNVDYGYPRYFKVAYSNIKKHEGTEFIGKAFCLFPRLVRKATDSEVALLSEGNSPSPKSTKKQPSKTARKTSAKKNN